MTDTAFAAIMMKPTAQSNSQASGPGVRLIIADDHVLVRQGLAMLLKRLDGIEVVAEASDGEQAIALAREHRPDVVLMDVHMPVLDGLKATERLARDLPGVRVIGLSMYEGDEIGAAMRRVGAAGYLSKDCSAVQLASMIRNVAAAARA